MTRIDLIGAAALAEIARLMAIRASLTAASATIRNAADMLDPALRLAVTDGDAAARLSADLRKIADGLA